MKQTKQTSMMTIATLVASVAVGGVVIQGILGGGNAALTGATATAKSFVFCDGTQITSKGTPFTMDPNKGEINGGMMTATTCTNTTGLQLGTQRQSAPGYFDFFVVWDAPAVNDTVTFFVSAVNITSVSVVAGDTTYADGSHCSFTFTGYPNSMSFSEGATVSYTSITSTLGTGTTYTSTTSAISGTNFALVTTAAMSGVNTVAFKITAKQVGNTAHFQKFTVNWSC